MSDISDRHKAFIDEYLINGMNGTQAYHKVYPDVTDETAKVNASKLLTNANVIEYLESERKLIRERSRMSKDDKLGLLESIMAAENKNLTIKAIEVHNKMTGDNEPDKVEHSGQKSIKIIKPDDK